MTGQDEPREEPARRWYTRSDEGIRPIPDPTVLTTEALRREVAALKEIMNREIAALKELVLQMLRAADRVADERWDRVQSQLKAMEAEALQSVAQLRRERELVTTAQMEAIAKSDQATSMALDKAEVANDKRFESVAAFREQQRDSLAGFLPREVADAQFADLRRMIADLTEKLSKLA